MIRLKTFLLLLSLVASSKSFAQDPMFSQVFVNKMVYNPAYTGNSIGVHGLMAHRSQWTSVPSAFNSSNIQVTTAVPKAQAGLGGMVTRNLEGEGRLKTLSADLVGSKMLRLIHNKNAKMFGYFGLGVSFNHKSINWGGLVFGDQLNPVSGISNGTSQVQTPSEDTQTYPDFNSGVALKGAYKSLFYDFGFSVDHIVEPNESTFKTKEGRLPRKYISNIFFGIPLNKLLHKKTNQFFLIPGFIVQKQQVFTTSMF